MARLFPAAISAATILVTLLVTLSQASNFPNSAVANRYNKEGPSLFWTRQGEEYRLPKTLEPTFYTIQLLPFIEPGNFTTDGHIEISIDCLENTNNITLNSGQIVIDPLSISVITILISID